MSVNYRFGKGRFRDINEGYEKEWLEGNGIGGFANSSLGAGMNRIHSGYLVASLNPPVDRIKILAKTSEELMLGDEKFNLGCQMYKDGSKNEEGFKYIEKFEFDGIAHYTYQVNDFRMVKSICLEHGHNTVVICYDIITGNKEAKLKVTSWLSCRDNNDVYESVKDMDFASSLDGNVITIHNNNDDRYCVKIYSDAGVINSSENLIIDDLRYAIDERNGFTGSDIVYTPYDISVCIKEKTRFLFYIKCTIEELDNKDGFTIMNEYLDRLDRYIKKLPYSDELTKKLAVSADAFIVKRKSTGLKTILAGFPWFTDWGRDTMIAITGLTLCTGRYKDNEEILESFSKYLKNGLIPNMFPSADSEQPIYNTVDASLWYFYAVDKYLEYTGKKENYDFIEKKIYPCLKEIINAYESGTDFSIKMDSDGLIMAGSDLDQVTWMDVRVGDWVVTPRHGKPVEISALWYNALKVMEKLSRKFGEDSSKFTSLSEMVKKSFNEKFWNEDKNCLYDVVDENDDKVRPNQIWAVSLPYTMLDRDKEKKIVDTVYEELYTSYGLRTLSYRDKEYVKEYIGPLSKRDAAYHMGTTWPFPEGGFISAFCKVNDYSDECIKRAKQMVEAFTDHMDDGCIGGIAEVFDGTNPCTGNGCYSQAWSVGEVLRAYVEDVVGKGNRQ